MTTVRIKINGTVQQHDVEDRTLLIHYIRENSRLTGAHIGCDTSNCGACTVILNGQAVKSCTVLAVQADGEEVTTVEGISGKFNGLSAVQEGFRQEHGLQCGYCTQAWSWPALPYFRKIRNLQSMRSAMHLKETYVVAPDTK